MSRMMTLTTLMITSMTYHRNAMEKIKIKCPNDGGILTVQKVIDIESKFVTCPTCKQRMKFTDFKVIQDSEEETTILGMGKNMIIGKLTVKSTGQSYQLKMGKNVIGRKSPKSSADMQIDCPNNRMSREHLIVEVRKTPTEGFVHYARLFKGHVNATFVNDLELEEGDEVILKNKNIIKLPDVDVEFTLPDEDETDI